MKYKNFVWNKNTTDSANSKTEKTSHQEISNDKKSSQQKLFTVHLPVQPDNGPKIGNNMKPQNSPKNTNAIHLLTELKNTTSVKAEIIDISGWWLDIIIDKFKHIEGIVLTATNRYKYFFVKDSSALNFLMNFTNDNNEFCNEILELRKKLKILKENDEKVNFISDKENATSVLQRKMLCKHLGETVYDYSPVDEDEIRSFIHELFNYETRIVYGELSKFVSQQLYYSYKCEEMNAYSIVARQHSSNNTNTKEEAPKTEEPLVEPILPVDTTTNKSVIIKDGVLVSIPSFLETEEYRVPDSIEEIGERAFSNTNGIQRVVIGPNVKVIRKEAFYHNSSLASIYIPVTVETVESNAFSYCNNLRAVVVHSKSDDISPQLFSNCPKMQTLTTTNTTLKENVKTTRKHANAPELRIYGPELDKKDILPSLDPSKSIFVMGNIHHCLKSSHKITTMWIKLPVKIGRELQSYPICVFHCKQCKRYFILPDIYEYYIARYNFTNPEIFVTMKYDSWYKGRRYRTVDEKLWTGLKDESLLRELGYTVASGVSLSQHDRLLILKSGIEHGIFSKAKAEDHLHFLINFNGKNPAMRECLQKWKSDVVKLHGMKCKEVNYIN